jgi:hypothetical protein
MPVQPPHRALLPGRHPHPAPLTIEVRDAVSGYRRQDW